MNQFALLAGLIITALLLNTAVFVLSILLLYALPTGVTSSVTAYAGILIGLALLAWLILLGGGAAILHQERHGHSSMPLKLGIMITVLLVFTIVFIFSCILLSVFQNDLQGSLVTARNYIASILALIFVAWVLLLTGTALLSKGVSAPARPYLPEPPPLTQSPIELQESAARPYLPEPKPYAQPLTQWPVELQGSAARPHAYGMTRGRKYSMTCSGY